MGLGQQPVRLLAVCISETSHQQLHCHVCSTVISSRPSAVGLVQKQKARLEDMIAEEAKIDGLEHVECKVFK